MLGAGITRAPVSRSDRAYPAANLSVTTLGRTDIFGLPEVFKNHKARLTVRSTTLLLAAAVVWVALGAAGAHAELLRGIWPICWEPWAIQQANVAASQGKWDDVKKLNCSVMGALWMRVRVIRCAADVTDEKMRRFTHPVPRDDSLLTEICEVELFGKKGNRFGIYYTYYFNMEWVQ